MDAALFSFLLCRCFLPPLSLKVFCYRLFPDISFMCFLLLLKLWTTYFLLIFFFHILWYILSSSRSFDLSISNSFWFAIIFNTSFNNNPFYSFTFNSIRYEINMCRITRNQQHEHKNSCRQQNWCSFFHYYCPQFIDRVYRSRFSLACSCSVMHALRSICAVLHTGFCYYHLFLSLCGCCLDIVIGWFYALTVGCVKCSNLCPAESSNPLATKDNKNSYENIQNEKNFSKFFFLYGM